MTPPPVRMVWCGIPVEVQKLAAQRYRFTFADWPWPLVFSAYRVREARKRGFLTRAEKPE